IVTADQLHNHIDFRILSHFENIRCHSGRAQITVRIELTSRHQCHHNGTSSTRSNLFRIALQNIKSTPAHGSKTTYANSDWIQDYDSPDCDALDTAPP